MIKHFPVSKVLSVYTHILISITSITSTIISVMFFRTVNDSGTISVPNYISNYKLKIKSHE